YLAGGLFFLLAAMTYVEGASLHQERAGATVFARYAFNELWSFVAGWALLLDYAILIAVTTFSATNYLAAYWKPLGEGGTEVAIGRRGLRRLIASAGAAVMVIYVGVALVTVSALPGARGEGRISNEFVEAPMLSVARAFDGRWNTDLVRYVVAAAAAATLIA